MRQSVTLVIHWRHMPYTSISQFSTS